jgi:hypothetical protein
MTTSFLRLDHRGFSEAVIDPNYVKHNLAKAKKAGYNAGRI